MIAATLFALALAQAGSTAATQPSHAADQPVATSGPAAGLAPVGDGDVPRGAPEDDYGLVAWCQGALTGHMALYPVVEPELKSIERPGEEAQDVKADHEQMEAGRDYLTLYKHALAVAEKTGPKTLHERGATIETQGEGIWTAAKDAQPRARMWTWLMWDLPGRCEVAAKRLVAHKGQVSEANASDSVSSDTAQATPQGAGSQGAKSQGANPQSIDDALPASGAPAPAAEPALRGPQ